MIEVMNDIESEDKFECVSGCGYCSNTEKIIKTKFDDEECTEEKYKV